MSESRHAAIAAAATWFDGGALLADLQKAKPASSKGVYLRRIAVSSTMGPGVGVDQASLGA